MVKLNKQSKHSEKKIEVLIENYNTKKKALEIGRQERTILSLKEIEKLLGEMPTKVAVSENVNLDDLSYDQYIENPVTDAILEFLGDMEEIEDYGFHPRIITKDFIIWRRTDDKCECLKKFFKWFILKIPFHHKDYFILKDFKKFVTKQEEKRSYVKLLNFIIPFLLPSLLLFLLFLAFNYYINQYGSNLFFIIFWFWLIFLALVNLSYSLSFHYKKGKIEYYTPLLSHFKSYNLSGFIILLVLVIGLIYFGIIFLVLGFSGVDFVGLIFVGPIPEYVDIFGFIIPGEWIIIGVTLAIVGFFIYLLIQILGRGYPVIIAPFQIVYVYHKFNKAKKLYILHYLNKYLQQENLDWKEKNYYLQLIIEIDKIPITTIDFFTKLIALLTFLISIVPPYLIPLFQ